MPKHFQREIEKVKRELLQLAALVEERLHEAVKSILERNSEAALRVIELDSQIDQMEVDVEEECLKILALHQPVAIDLRFLVAVLKINNDLERIGDLAANIAERALFLNAHPAPQMPVDLQKMVSKVQEMLKTSLDALVNLDPDLARQVCAADDEVDAMNRDIISKIQKGILDRPELTESFINIFSASRQLERIADHATNIAEDVMYMASGEIVRHRAASYPQ